MQLSKFVTKLVGNRECQKAQPPDKSLPPVQAPAARPAQAQPKPAITLGVKYNCRYSCHILPPAGWRRQENTSGPAWPQNSVSPYFVFSHPDLEPGEQAMIRWQLKSLPETRASHAHLEELFSGEEPLQPECLLGLEAPGIVAGMKVIGIDRIALPSGLQALLILAKYAQCKGEAPVMRYVVVLPDRELVVNGEVQWYRETLQFLATEASFSAHEMLAIASIKTFRRTTGATAANEDRCAVALPIPPSTAVPGR